MFDTGITHNYSLFLRFGAVKIEMLLAQLIMR